MGSFYTPNISGRNVFYNHSSWDGNNAGADSNDDLAVAPDKSALLPGQTATGANYTSYSRGINGVMVNLRRLPFGAVLSSADFTFKVGNDSTPSSWATAAAPSNVSIRPIVVGNETVDRVTLIWPDYDPANPSSSINAVANKWLQVTVKADANTGLTQPDVFYFGNLIGESYYDPTTGYINSLDQSATRQHWGETATAANLYDHNRDGSVNSADSDIVPANVYKQLILLAAPA